MPSVYWVIGGEYRDTDFRELVEGATEDKLGPFSSYQEAKAAWQGRAWATVDSCNKRYRIVEESHSTPTRRYWVIGGDYLDPGFRQMVEGTQEERLGPYDTYQAAHDAWQERAWSTVDSCTRRFRIVEESSV